MAATVTARYEQLLAKAGEVVDKRGYPKKIRIQVGNATCENAAGSREVLDELTKHLEASGRSDITIHQTGCTGRCSCEPIVGVALPGESLVKYQRVDREKAHEIFSTHVLGGKPVENLILDDQPGVRARNEFFFCNHPNCKNRTEMDMKNRFEQMLAESDLEAGTAAVIQANCLGLCKNASNENAAYILALPSRTVYQVNEESDLQEILDCHIAKGQTVERLAIQHTSPATQLFFELYGDVAFFNKQSRIALRNAGIVNPEDIDEHIALGGFHALATTLDKNDPQWLIGVVTDSKLRGRGGGGYPTGKKWANAAAEQSDTKYIICNADEGDPGAFMDRSMLESDPLSVLEGMVIGGFAIGASWGYIYVRAEYPLAINRIENALSLARQRGLLGKNILNSGFDFDVEIRLGAGAFVCGEETALIHSIEGKRGEPRIRPPYPSTSGLWGKPTVINNVETFANIPVIIQYGAEWFARIGSKTSGGTKVFALAGKVRQTGLVEVPMGTTLRQIVYDIGGGIPNDKKLKAIQTGGPAGGCLPEEWLDTPVDFDSLAKAGSIMGSGGMIIMDEDDCMVDIARYFLTFSQDESCGKCTPCREGSKRMLEILNRITTGKGVPEDIAKLQRLGKLMQKASLCGLGRAAANPVLSTLKYYRDEYDAHINDKYCSAHKCTSLVTYIINEDKCIGCTACARNCPVTCISGKPKESHLIDQSQCIKCGRCYEVCKFDAVIRQ